MAFEELRAEIAMLLGESIEQPEDIHELRELIRERLNELRATGMPLPDDLVELENRLALEEELGTEETGEETLPNSTP